ncbi:Protein translocase subunit SecF [Ketogulonicigenium robustum]|uniref:Protein-export membrane protein SecF n=1 Tax=Ketogulonicigenium robustum TaxID=92947 RepID=A0A1W6NZ77_9RHOB|nr:protein translocase subunit SecF [Ketogulonicigenium robustum]ARO14552.1 Protein translocase subunit SecF [Ketogulonicigenium robustum]
MAFRLKLVPTKTSIDFFKWGGMPTYASFALAVASIIAVLTMGMNYGIDFLGGTTIRTESSQNVEMSEYRSALDSLELSDVTITEVFDPSFRADQFVKQVRIQSAQDTDASNAMIAEVEAALRTVDPQVVFTAVETVGPKVSGELIQTALLAVAASLIGIMAYVWLRFEWQFGAAAVVGLFHDAVLTVGLFSVLQVKFDLTIVAALLTIIGFSINDTVVVFDRVREILRRDQKSSLREILNIALNETLSRTVMTTLTTMLALLALYIWGGDVIRGFAFAMLFGALVGVYSTVFICAQCVLWLGVKRDWDKKPTTGPSGTQFPTSTE